MEPTLIRHRADTLDNWLLVDPVIPARQKVIITDTNQEVLGDGVSLFSELTPLGIQGPAGEDGLSAFELAQADGYAGDVDEWLLSLYGDDGLSAYEVAVENGFVGTQAEWLESLKGEPGTGSGGGIADAPQDGKFYVRKDGAWVEAPSGGSGGTGAKELLFFHDFEANPAQSIGYSGATDWDFIVVTVRHLDGMSSTSGHDVGLRLRAAQGAAVEPADRTWVSDAYDGGSNGSSFGCILYARSASNVQSNSVTISGHNTDYSPTIVGPGVAPHNSNSGQVEQSVSVSDTLLDYFEVHCASVINRGTVHAVGYRFT